MNTLHEEAKPYMLRYISINEFPQTDMDIENIKGVKSETSDII